MKRLELYFPIRKPYFITQFFGQNNLPIYKELGLLGHNGIDVACQRGTPVLAAHDGIIVYAGMDGNEGIGVVIRTNEQFLDINNQPQWFKSLYWHLINNVPVRVGQQVRIGDIIGYANSTGLSGGDHLHFGLKPQYPGENNTTWWNSENTNGYKGAIDPEQYFIKNSPFPGRNIGYISAYEIKSSLQSIAEQIKIIAESIAKFILKFKK